MQRLRTIGQVFDYTFNNLESWDHNHEGRKTNVTNSNKFIDIHGRSLQISKIKQPTMDVVKTVLRERDDASNRTVNLCVGTTQVALNFCLGRGLIPWPDPRELFIKNNRYSFPMLEVKRVDKPIFSKSQVIQMYENFISPISDFVPFFSLLDLPLQLELLCLILIFESQ